MNQSDYEARRIKEIEELFITKLPDRYHKYLIRGTRYDDIISHVILDIQKELEVERELAKVAIRFLKRNGTPCCDKTNTMPSCKGCNYNRLITGEIDEVRQWCLDVPLRGY